MESGVINTVEVVQAQQTVRQRALDLIDSVFGSQFGEIEPGPCAGPCSRSSLQPAQTSNGPIAMTVPRLPANPRRAALVVRFTATRLC